MFGIYDAIKFKILDDHCGMTKATPKNNRRIVLATLRKVGFNISKPGAEGL